jgi:hypothetical protein
MEYKFVTENDTGVKIYQRIDDDGICRFSCNEFDPDYQAWVALGNTASTLPSELSTPTTPQAGA